MAKAPKAEETPEAPTEKITKTEAVRRALAEGLTKAADAIEFMKTKFGIEMTPQAFSVNKSQLKKKEEGTTPRAPRATAPASAPSAQNGDDGLGLARSVRELVNQYGAEKVKAMADIIAG